jgi:hypothetical protein
MNGKRRKGNVLFINRIVAPRATGGNRRKNQEPLRALWLLMFGFGRTEQRPASTVDGSAGRVV